MSGDQRLSDERAPANNDQSVRMHPTKGINVRRWSRFGAGLPFASSLTFRMNFPRAAAMADLQLSGSLPPLRRSKSRRTAWGVCAIRSALRCSKPIAKPVIIPSSNSICRILATTSAPRPSSAPLLFWLPLHRRRRRIFELQPIRGPAGTIARAQPLGDDAFSSPSTAKAAGPRVSVTWARCGLEPALPRKMVATARTAAPRINVTWSKRRASRQASPRAHGRDPNFHRLALGDAASCLVVAQAEGRESFWLAAGSRRRKRLGVDQILASPSLAAL